ncbi:MAG: transcription antitermination factor NusB [Hydrogenophilus sp.]|nr:transcription antitermination factor NusB [Hydrogenophilus sp.]
MQAENGGRAEEGGERKRGRGPSRRRLARELALRGVYEWLISGHDVTAIERGLREDGLFARADHELFLELLRGAVLEAERWRKALAPFARRGIEEVTPIEQAVLLIAAVEFDRHPETNHRVILDEAIELTKRYGAEEGFRFVNGVLDRFARAVRPFEFEHAQG